MSIERQKRYVPVVCGLISNWICDAYTLPLQKDTSRDSEDESNDEEQSDEVSSLPDQRNNGWGLSLVLF